MIGRTLSHYLSRFQREAKDVAALNHPSIVTVHSVEESDSIHFITMEYVEGSTLRALLENGALQQADAHRHRYGIRIAEGLVKAHEAGIVHRDLKPDNVMIDKDRGSRASTSAWPSFRCGRIPAPKLRLWRRA